MNDNTFFAKIFLWKRFSSFFYLNTTQFLLTLIDSIFRLLVAYSLIEKLGKDQSSTIIFISGVLFVSPFLIFSMPAGELADKYSKQKVIIWSLIIEVLAILYGVFAMIKCSTFSAYASLFCIAFQSSIFLPSKYAILPEIVPKENLSKANSYMTLATYLAIIFGTFLASFFTQITNRSYFMVACFCLIMALIAFYSGLQIQKTSVKNPTKKINPLFLIQVFKSLKLAKKYPHLLLVVLSSSYFLYMASFTQLNLIPFAIQSLKITDVQSGYILLAAALGIGVGSIVVAIISGKNIELGISIWGAFGSSLSYIILVLFSNNIVMATLMMFSFGAHGGLYIVPLDAYIQVASPEKDIGEIVAAGTFLGFVGVLLAALSLGFFSDVLHITAAQGYLVVGLISLSISFIITFFLPEYVSRILAITLFKACYHLNIKNQPKTEFFESVCIICKRYSFIKILSLIYLYPRIAFIRYVHKMPFCLMRPFYSILHIVPIPIDDEILFEKELKKAVDKKMPLCFFLESKSRMNKNNLYAQITQKIFNKLQIPAISVNVTKKPTSPKSKNFFKVFKKFPIQLDAHFSDKITETLSIQKVQALVDIVDIKSVENNR